MRIVLVSSLLVLSLSAACFAADEEGIVARWDFTEGNGTVLHDSGGNDNHGEIHGAQWVKRGKGYALRFDGVDDYVDCGAGPSLDLTDSITLEAWVHPLSLPLGREPGILGKFFTSYALTLHKMGSCHFYISSGGNYCRTPTEVGAWHHIAATFDGTKLKLYRNGQEEAFRESKLETIRRGKNLLMGCIAGDPSASDRAFRDTTYFNGMLDDVKIYDRALSADEVLMRYKRNARDYGMDTAWFNKLRLTPFYYFGEQTVLLDVDFAGCLPLPKEAHLQVALRRAGQQDPLQQHRLSDLPKSGKTLDIPFKTTGFTRGQYEIHVILKDATGTRAEERLSFSYPPPAMKVASPREKVVAPLAPPATPVPYEVDLHAGGGFSISVRGDSYPVESTYSYPHGGENGLRVRDAPDRNAEPTWRVTTRKVDAMTYQASASGKYYSIDRLIVLHPNHVEVKDTIKNVRDAELGIILSNHINVEGKDGVKAELMENPTVFIKRKGLGLGMVALDDVYLVQYETYFTKGVAGGIRTDKFGLDKGASYTLEWAIYPNDTGDYYDFINQVRKDEGLIRTVDGGFACGGMWTTGYQRMAPPSREAVDLRGLKYGGIGCLSKMADDPRVAIEGVEFIEYPKERARLTEFFGRARKIYPELKLMFHIAHSLYATTRPDELFPDSRVIDSSGKQAMWGGGKQWYVDTKRFTPELLEQGMRWWAFYPTLDNSFGKAMLRATDMMLDEMGATGIFADGLSLAYCGKFTHDRWDGHSVEIDAKTKTVTKKAGSVLLLSQGALVAMMRKINAKGGVVIINGHPGTRTLNKEDSFYCAETLGGDRSLAGLYLSPSVIGLGNAGRLKVERDVYYDIRGKLEWGGLYYYLGEDWYGKTITYKSVTSQMFPITVEELRPGYIKGSERSITMHSGVYGWHGDPDLHMGYRYDGRGALAPSGFLTTVDRSGVRTDIALQENETAVLKKIPVTLDAQRPVNLVVVRYDDAGIQLILNGKGEVGCRVRDGDFAVKPGDAYVTKADGLTRVTADERGGLSFRIILDGHLELGIERAEGK